MGRYNLRMNSMASLAFVCSGLLLLLSGKTVAENWPAWHGPHGSGIAREIELPTRWSNTENIRWKIPLPDRGNSSPIVWENKVFITQAIESENRLTLMCFDRAKGELLWQTGTNYKEKDQTHETNPYASASPVTDGERVIAWFGSEGLFCYDFKGKEVWKQNFGKQTHGWGYGASPIIYKDLCILHFGPGERTFLVALDKKTGQQVWRVDLPEPQPKQRTDGFAGRTNGVIGSWSTPIIVNANGRDELVLSVPEQIRAFDPKTGKDLWTCRGLNPLIYTSQIAGDGVIVAMGGFMGTAVAVKPGGNGDVTETHRLWQIPSKKNRLGSGVIFNGHVYVLNSNGIAECMNLQTGETIWEERLKALGPKSESWSSMVLVGDNIYVLNQSGDTLIVKASPKFEMVGSNSIGNELTNSSLAVSKGELFIRTHQHLWCISEPNRKSADAKTKIDVFAAQQVALKE